MHSIWAVAKNTIKQALRLKIAVVFILLLLILLPTLGVTVTGDGTIKGRMQTFVSYGLSLTSFLLSVLAISVSVYTITSDIKEKQIFTVLTKPIRRFQLILGKFLGVFLLNTSLLIIFASIIYGVTLYLPKHSDASPAEMRSLENEFLTARASRTPADPDVTEEVRQHYEMLKDNRRLPEGIPRHQIIQRLTTEKKIEKRAAGVGQRLIWEFDNVRPEKSDQGIFIKYKYDVAINPPDLQVYGSWRIGDNRPEANRPPYVVQKQDIIRTAHEFEIPADAVAEDGYLAVEFLNVPVNETVIMFPAEDGLEVLYKADSFTANFIRANLLIFARLFFLTSLGIMAASFLSFPVAMLGCMVVFATASISGFIVESFEFFGSNVFYTYVIGPIVNLIPKFDVYNPSRFLVEGRLITWQMLATALGLMIALKSVLLMILALIIFTFREIAKVIV